MKKYNKYVLCAWMVLVLACASFGSVAYADFGLELPTDTFANFMLHICKLLGIFGMGLCVVRLGMAVQERDTENTLQNICFTIACMVLAFLKEILVAIGLM